MSQTFFTSDLHFCHKNIAKFCPHTRPQIKDNDTTVLNQYMIDWWNDTVDIDDDVYNLGDLVFSRNLTEIIAILKQLNGRHHLIFGNHDDIIQNNLDIFLTTKKHDGNPLLSSAQHYKKLALDNKTLVLFHYPIFEWDGCHKGYYHLHGHIHERMADIGGRILNVGFDLHGRFLTIADIDDYLSDLPKRAHFDDNSPFNQLNIPSILENDCQYHTAKTDEQCTNNKEYIRILIKQKLLSNCQDF